MEIERRRRQATTDGNEKCSTQKSSTSKSSTKSVIRSDVKPFKALPAGMLKNDQHDQLMEEFRRVHRKMFSAPSTTSTDESESEKEKEKVKEPERTQSNTSENTKEEKKDKLMPNAAKAEIKEMPTGKSCMHRQSSVKIFLTLQVNYFMHAAQTTLPAWHHADNLKTLRISHLGLSTSVFSFLLCD